MAHRSILVALAWLCAACTERSLVLAEDEPVRDLAASVPRDLASPRDLAEPPFDGPQRHLGEPCAHDGECLSGTCFTPELTRGQWNHVCGAACDAQRPCLEGACVSYDFDVYWCVNPCDFQKHSSDCLPQGFLCCQGGPIDVCVSPAAITCMPL
jgi:hypothetical protein